MPGVGLADARNRLSALTNEANATGKSFVIYKNNQPWAEVRPLSVRAPQVDAISITPLRHEVQVANLDELFSEYEGGFVPREDGLASPAGREEW